MTFFAGGGGRGQLLPPSKVATLRMQHLTYSGRNISLAYFRDRVANSTRLRVAAARRRYGSRAGSSACPCINLDYKLRPLRIAGRARGSEAREFFAAPGRAISFRTHRSDFAGSCVISRRLTDLSLASTTASRTRTIVCYSDVKKLGRLIFP